MKLLLTITKRKDYPIHLVFGFCFFFLIYFSNDVPNLQAEKKKKNKKKNTNEANTF